MIHIPSYQVLAFLDWLCNHGVILPDRSPIDDERKNLETLATEYLTEKVEVENPGKNNSTLKFLLLVFQSCDGIEESTIEEQVAHFSNCGRCYFYCRDLFCPFIRVEKTDISETSQHISWIFWDRLLHPLLNGFHDWTIDNKIEIFLDEAWNYHDEMMDHLRFRKFISEKGEEFAEQFGKYIAYVKQESPGVIEDYLRWKKERIADNFRLNETGFRKFDEETKPINSNSTTEQEAKRLADSAVRAWSKEYREFFAREMEKKNKNYQMNMVVQGTRLLPQSLEFLDWLKKKMPDLRLPGNIPPVEFQRLASDFCLENGYNNGNEFAKEVTHWLYGSVSKSVVVKIINLFGWKEAERSFKNPHRGTENPLDRYKKIRFHALFLMAKSNGYDAFIKKNWTDLNSMTGDWIDLYYSQDDLNGVSAYDSIKMFKSFMPTADQIPSLVIWEDLSNPSYVKLEGLWDNDIMEVLKHVVTYLQSSSGNSNVNGSGAFPSLAEAARIGNKKAQELRIMNKSVSSVTFNTFSGVGVASVSNNSNNDNRGAIFAGRDMVGNNIQQNVDNKSLGTSLNAHDIEYAKNLVHYFKSVRIDGLSESQQTKGQSYLQEIEEASPGDDGSSAIKSWREWLKGQSKQTLEALSSALPTVANGVTLANDNVVMKAIKEALSAFFS